MMKGFAMLSGLPSAHKQNNCTCGCVPNIMSLHDQAKERARRREEAAAAVKKPTLSEYLAEQRVPPLPTPAEMNNLEVMECAETCDDDEPES